MTTTAALTPRLLMLTVLAHARTTAAAAGQPEEPWTIAQDAHAALADAAWPVESTGRILRALARDGHARRRPTDRGWAYQPTPTGLRALEAATQAQ